MDTLARACHNGTQQSDQHYHRTLSQPTPLRVQPHAQLRQSVTNPQRLSRITNTDDDQELRRRHSSAQQSRRSKRGTPSTIPPPRTSLARRVPPETPSSESQTHPKATTRGSQLIKFMPLNLSSIINPQEPISHPQHTFSQQSEKYISQHHPTR